MVEYLFLWKEGVTVDLDSPPACLLVLQLPRSYAEDISLPPSLSQPYDRSFDVSKDDLGGPDPVSAVAQGHVPLQPSDSELQVLHGTP